MGTNTLTLDTLTGCFQRLRQILNTNCEHKLNKIVSDSARLGMISQKVSNYIHNRPYSHLVCLQLNDDRFLSILFFMTSSTSIIKHISTSFTYS